MFKSVWEFGAALTTQTDIFLGNSRDDIKPGRKPAVLYQSQQVCISQAGAWRWAQIFAQAGKRGPWVGAWERTEESLCNRPKEGRLTRLHPRARRRRAAGSCSPLLFEPLTEGPSTHRCPAQGSGENSLVLTSTETGHKQETETHSV